MDSDTDATTPSLLRQLRRCGTLKQWSGGIDGEESLRLLVQHQSEFPARIRHAIQAEADAPTSIGISLSRIRTIVSSFFFDQLENHKATTESEGAPTIGGGLDCQVDKEEEVELTIRFFPHVLRTTVRKEDRLYSAVGWATTRLKSLPFVPLMAELENEVGGGVRRWRVDYYESWGHYFGPVSEVSPLRELITNECLLPQERRTYKDEEDLHRRIDETCFSVLDRLKEKGLIGNGDIWNCMEDLLMEPSSRTKKRLRSLIDWEPILLQRSVFGSILGDFLNRCCHHPGTDDKLERFRDLAELGMSHYPHQLGFLFSPRPSFQTACRLFGEQKVTTVVNDCIRQWTRGRNDDAVRDLVFAAATEKDITLDGVYFLLRRDPAAFMPLLSKACHEEQHWKQQQGSKEAFRAALESFCARVDPIVVLVLAFELVLALALLVFGVPTNLPSYWF